LLGSAKSEVVLIDNYLDESIFKEDLFYFSTLGIIIWQSKF
jgi:hypothetical protein